MRLIATVIALLCLAGCDVFDPALYMSADSGTPDSGALDSAIPDSALDSAVEDATPDADAGFSLADRCSASAPELPSLSENIVVDTTALADEVSSEVTSCAGSTAPGHEGFFSVEMHAGEKWHFHVTALEAAGDPIVYVLGTDCDARACQRGEATNVCNLRDEHFTFVAPDDGTYLVAVDDANDRGGTYEVLPIQPDCGNGVVEHSEACDEESAACTDTCLGVLGTGGMEVEPNDDPPGANVLDFTSGTVRGDVASQCDLASFQFTAPAGATLTATVLPRGMATCNTAAPALDLELVSTDGRTLYGSVSAGPGECPTIEGTEAFATGLSAGDYALRLVPTADETSLYDFDLTIDVATP
jgi:hypothetical protein